MKKIFSIILISITAIGLWGCGNNGISEEEYNKVVAERDALKSELAEAKATLNNQKEYETLEDKTESESQNETTNTIEEVKNEDIEILAEYTLPDGFNWYTRHFMIIKNNSNNTVDISTSSLAYGKDGTIVAAADASFKSLGAGCVSVFYEAFETGAEIDHYDTDINVSPSKYYKSAIQDLSYVQNDIDGGAVFQVTNNGQEAAYSVEGYAMFFLGDELIGYDLAYFSDDDSEIKPEKTISKQLTSYNKNFDRIEFYLTGRR